MLRSTQPTVSSLVQQPHHATRFRLDALSESLFELLDQLLDGKTYLLSRDRMTSLDCLALGYLMLALVPDVPHPWLAQMMKSKYPKLCHFVEDLARDCLGTTLHPQPAEKTNTSHTDVHLPWITPEKTSSHPSIRPVIESLPFLGPLYSPATLQDSTNKTNHESSIVPIIPTIFAGLTATLAALGSYVLYTGEIPFALQSAWPVYGQRRPQRLHDMGEAGAMLGGVDLRTSQL